MRCAQCGASLGEDHRFCGDCGAPVGGCPSCGEPLTPGKRFCHACGYALSDAARVPPVNDQVRELVAALTSAISGLRTMSSPYHLAHGLLDHAGYLMKQGDADAAAAAITEACGIASRLRCEPLLDRAEAIEPAEPRMGADR